MTNELCLLLQIGRISLNTRCFVNIQHEAILMLYMLYFCLLGVFFVCLFCLDGSLAALHYKSHTDLGCFWTMVSVHFCLSFWSFLFFLKIMESFASKLIFYIDACNNVERMDNVQISTWFLLISSNFVLLKLNIRADVKDKSPNLQTADEEESCWNLCTGGYCF